MARSKPIKSTADALAWIEEQVSAGRMAQPRIIDDGEKTVVVYEHKCTRCGGSGIYMALSGRCGSCFTCSNGTVRKRLAPIEFAKRLRVNLRGQERRAAAKQARVDASKAANLARGFGEVTGAELHTAIDRAGAELRRSKARLRKHVGHEGETLSLGVVVTCVKDVTTRYGARTLTVMVTDEGHILTHWGKAPITSGERPRVRIEATVKKHAWRLGEARTELSNLEVLAVERHDPIASAEELLVLADSLECVGANPIADVERQQLAKGTLPDWVRREWTDHPATRSSILAARAHARRAA